MAVTPLTLPRGAGAPDRPSIGTATLAALLLGSLAAGIGSAWALMGETPPIGVVRVGVWEAYPRLGGADVDPYGRVLLARAPHLPLAAGEGLQLTAAADEAGQSLTGRCRYRISGATLPSRGWTLTVVNRSGRPFAGQRASALGDADLVVPENGRVEIIASAAAASGNWLRLPAGERVGLVLRFYDTPLSAGVGQLPPSALPRIERLDCAG